MARWTTSNMQAKMNSSRYSARAIGIAALTLTVFVSDALAQQGERAEAPEAKPELEAKAGARDTAGLPFYATARVARVGKHDISADTYNEQVRFLLKISQGKLAPSTASRHKLQLLERVIDDYILDEAMKTQKLSVSREELDAEVQRSIARYPSQEQFEGYLKYIGLSMETFRGEIERRVRIEKLVQTRYDTTITDAQLEAHYQDNIGRWSQAAQVHAAHILVKVERGATPAERAKGRARAEEIVALARAEGADFTELAREHSEGPTAPRGGDLGFFPKNRMIKPFAEAAFALEPGEVSGVVETVFGFHVIKVYATKPERVIPLEEVKTELRRQMKETLVREKLQELLNEEKKRLGVERFEKHIEVREDKKP